jgi:hypothetical protein
VNYLKIIDELAGHHSTEAASPIRKVELSSDNDGDLLPEGHPAYAILTVCARAGVALRIDADETLVVGKAGAKADEPTQPWSSLVVVIEAHLEAVALLVNSGWRLRATFPSGEAA